VSEFIDKEKVQRMRSVEFPFIMAGCEFLKHVYSSTSTATQDELQLFVEVTANIDTRYIPLVLDKASEAKNVASLNIPQLTHDALTLPGVRTCQSIGECTSNRFCQMCPNHGEVASPIFIHDSETIETEASGFYEAKMSKAGTLVRGKPCYTDLAKAFSRDNSFLTLADNKITYVFNGTHWEQRFTAEIENYAQTHFDPPPSNSQRTEFLKLIQCSNLKRTDWLSKSSEGMVNFRNGVYDIKENSLGSHSPDFGFRYVLPYNYDDKATCPVFDQMLWDVTCGDKTLQKILLEFMGYALSNDRMWVHKALILFGTGANGKSTIIQTLKNIIGKQSVSEKSLAELNDPQNRDTLDGSLFHVAEEAGVDSLSKSEVFKRMIGGNGITIKKLYSQPYTIENKCKLIISCNDLPKSGDKSDGLYRRMLLVPFRAKFTDDIADKHIQQKLDRELPGIFNKVMHHYRDLLKRGSFPESDAVNKEMELYQEENDNMIFWRNERIEQISPTDPGFEDAFISKEALYSDYKSFILDGMQKPLSKINFGRQLKRVLPHAEECHKRVQYKNMRCIKGIRFDHELG
jgi:putative DNA primase/helicase